MTLGANEWLRVTLAERAGFWRLTAEQFRVAVNLVAIARVSEGAPRVVGSSDELERYFGMNRAKIRRTLDALERSGFCRVWVTRGRAATISIALLDSRPFDIQLSLPVFVSNLDGTQHHETVCESLADHGDRGRFSEELSSDDETKLSVEGRARDQDLLRSPSDPHLRSDPRSSDSRDLTGTEIQISTREKLAAWVEPEGAEQPKTSSRKRVDVDSIPDRAWAAADYLRERVLQSNPAAFVGRKQWDRAVKGGLRMDWANSFRLFHRKLVEALRNADAAAGDAEAWNEIAKTVRWLFHEQTVKTRFIVECPNTLSDKWDRIQAVRRNNAAKTAHDSQPRRPDGRPDTMAGRKLEKWSLDAKP